MSGRRWSRRSFSKLAVSAVSLPLLPGVVAAAAGEPPDLAAGVQAGDVPPLAERLPRTPRVVDMAALHKVEGRYGGALRMIMADEIGRAHV